MSSTNSFNRPAGSISIPVEIVPRSDSTPFRTIRNDYPYSDFSNSPPWNKPSINSYSTSHFRPRQTPTTAYDRLINNSPANRPLKDHYYQQRLYEPSTLHFSRSSDDLLSSPTDSIRSHTSIHPPTFTNNYHVNSDFLQPHKYADPLRRSYDTLNDYSDMQQQFPTNRQYPNHQSTFVNRNEYRVPVNHQQSNTFQGTTNISHDRSRSPASQRGESPTRPPPPSTSQQQQESDFKINKDATNSIPTSGQPPASSSLQSNDQQVPSTDSPLTTNIPRDPNTIALEKLEQIKQNLAALNQQVDAFTGSTRDDRIYKELDEQALKMMMRCDELIDVSAEIKEKRKEMIRNVQTVLAKLESKVPITSSIEHNNQQMETSLVVYDPQQEKSSNSPKEEQSI